MKPCDRCIGGVGVVPLGKVWLCPTCAAEHIRSLTATLDHANRDMAELRKRYSGVMAPDVSP